MFEYIIRVGRDYATLHDLKKPYTSTFSLIFEYPREYFRFYPKILLRGRLFPMFISNVALYITFAPLLSFIRPVN